MPIRLSGIEESFFILICICKLDYSVSCMIERCSVQPRDVGCYMGVCI